MQAKLFLFYLRFRKPITTLLFIFTVIVVGLNSWITFKEKAVDYTPWKLISVESGNRSWVLRILKRVAANLDRLSGNLFPTEESEMESNPITAGVKLRHRLAEPEPF